jgi:single-strand DNA-binding protein
MYQQITVVGYLGRDPHMQYTDKGEAFTGFSVAASRKYTNKNGQQVDETTWFNVTVFGRQAENCNQYLAKGRPVLVVGRLRPDQTGNPRMYDKADGTKGASFDINATWVQFLPGKGESNGAYQPGDIDLNTPAQSNDEVSFLD